MKKFTSLLLAATASFFAVGAAAQTVAESPTAASQLTDGYYVIKALYDNTQKESQNDPKNATGYIYHDSSNSSRPFQFVSGAETPNGSDQKYVWYLHKFSNDGGFTLQNASTGAFFPSYGDNNGNGGNFSQSTAIANAAILKYNEYTSYSGSLESGVTLYQDNYTKKTNIHANAPTGYYNLSYWEGGTAGQGSLVQFAFYKVDDITPTATIVTESYDLTYSFSKDGSLVYYSGAVKTASELSGTAAVPVGISQYSYYWFDFSPTDTNLSTSNHNFTLSLKSQRGDVPFNFTTSDSQTWYNVKFSENAATSLLLVQSDDASTNTLYANKSIDSYNKMAKGGAWAIVEDGYGVKIKNRLTGTFITEANGNNQTKATLSEDGTVFTVRQNGSGYTLQVPGYANSAVGNHVQGELGVWNNASAPTGAGSRWTFTEVTIDAARTQLSSELNLDNLNTADATADNIYIVKYNADEVTTAQNALTSATSLDDLDAVVAPTLTSTPDYTAYYRIHTANCTNGYISSSSIDVDTNGALTESSSNRTINRATADEAIVPQLWQFVANSDGTYKIRNANTGRCIGQHVASGTGLAMPVSDDYAGTFTIKQGYNTNKNSKVMLLESGHIINAFGGANNTIISEWNSESDGGGQWTVEKVTEIPVTISAAAGWASVALPFAVTTPTTEGVKAYYGKLVESNVVKLEEITATTIPANTGFLLAKEGGATVNLAIASEEGSAIEGNHLIGATAKRSGFEADGTYVLALNSAGKAAFLQSELTTVPANKAYILATDVEATEGAPAAVLNFNIGESTGITSAATATAEASVYYDLSGRRVLYPAKGIFVTANGEKVLLK